MAPVAPKARQLSLLNNDSVLWKSVVARAEEFQCIEPGGGRF